MTKKKSNYAIDGYYGFDTIADGPRPSECGGSGIHLQYDHDEVMEMGEYFYEEDPYAMEFDYDFGIREMLDEILAEELIDQYRAEWEKNNDGTEKEPDFELEAYESMVDMYHVWDDEFKQDCIDYYLAHKKD